MTQPAQQKFLKPILVASRDQKDTSVIFHEVGNKLFLDTRLRDIFTLAINPVRMNFHNKPLTKKCPNIELVEIFYDEEDKTKILIRAFSKAADKPDYSVITQTIDVDTTSMSLGGYDGEADYVPQTPAALKEMRDANTRWRVHAALLKLGAQPIEPINY